MGQESKEMPGLGEYVGTPTVYVYSNGKLERPSGMGGSLSRRSSALIVELESPHQPSTVQCAGRDRNLSPKFSFP